MPVLGRRFDLMQPTPQMLDKGVGFWQHERVGYLASPNLVSRGMLRLYYQVSVLRKRSKVSLDGRLAPHRLVEVGTEDHGGPGGQYRRREQVVGEPVRNLTERVGGGGQDQEHIGPVGQLDVTGLSLYRGVLI